MKTFPTMKTSCTGPYVRLPRRAANANSTPPPRRSILRASGFGGPAHFGSLARLASLVTCAGVLTTGVSARAQEVEEEPQESVEAAEEEALLQAAEQGATGEVEVEPSPPADEAPPTYEEPLDEVVVTSFRSSLRLALRKKQRAVGQLDAIVAEDIADFPDLNLAESLQRVPGVSITRQNGEGNRITVRGLSGLYTRTRVNGMEARAGIGNNGTRQFDFNLFASELFNSIVVHKTATASLDEGSLGAVVDLNTARAFDYKPGFTASAGAVGAYNDLSETVRPRITGLLAYHDPDELWGATVSAAYSKVRLDTVSTDTVAWQKADFQSVNGVVCADNTNDPGCVEVSDAFHPRIPRFGQNELSGDRVGVTAGFQLRPTLSTEIRLDGLYALYDYRNSQRRLFPLLRGNEGIMDLRDYRLQAQPVRFGEGNSSIVAGTVDNAWIRSENVRQDSEARFRQLTLSIEQNIDENMYLNVLAGTTRSVSGVPHDTTMNYDLQGYDGYRFDLGDDQAPIYAFEGLDVTDPTIFNVPEVRDRVAEVEGGFDTVRFDAHYDVDEGLNFVVGASYKRATFENRNWQRDGSVCGFDLFECDTNGDGEDDIPGPTGQADRTSQLDYRGEAGPGSATQWAVPNIDDWVNALGYYDVPLTQNQGGTNEVTENNLGAYLQAHGELRLGSGGLRLLYDGGLRYVETRQSSTGFNSSGVFETVDRPTYRDFLPSANTALWVTDSLVFRLGGARVMSRPELNSLSPGVGVDSFGYSVDFQNPNLNPTRATTVDLATEWYFGEDSMLSLAAFWKDIGSFPIRGSRTGTYASTGQPRDAIIALSPADVSGPDGEGTCGNAEGCWSIRELTNGPGATVKGLELGVQAPFRTFSARLPVVLRDMGIVANYTYVDAEAEYDFFGNTVTERLIGLSNDSFNGTLYYDDSAFSARVSVAYRSDFLTDGPNNQGNLWVYTEPNTRVDFASSYNVSDELKLSLEALNLTNAATSSRVDIDAERRALYNKNGRTFFLGARYTY